MTNEQQWFDVEKDGLPQASGTFICIMRGATTLRLMRYMLGKEGWIGVGAPGGLCKSVTHWARIPTPPDALYMNILLKKSLAEGLEDDEKLELAQLLKNSTG